jgi:hypothetical protein
MKNNQKLKNPIYTENLLECAEALCRKLKPVYEGGEGFFGSLGQAHPAYNALKASIKRILEDETDVPDANQLKLEL